MAVYPRSAFADFPPEWTWWLKWTIPETVTLIVAKDETGAVRYCAESSTFLDRVVRGI